MKIKSGAKEFDCVKWTRSARNRISRRIRKRSPDGAIRWYRGKRPTNPRLAELYDRLEPRATRRMLAKTSGEGTS